MAKTLWLKNGKLVVNDSSRPILCDDCPCGGEPCVSPREATVAWQHVKLTVDINRVDVSSGGVTRTYIGVFTKIYDRLAWISGETPEDPHFSLFEVDCCKCRWSPLTWHISGEIERMSSAGASDFIEFDFVLEPLWDTSTLQCAKDSEAGPDPVQYRAILDLVPSTVPTTPELVTTVDGVDGETIVDPVSTEGYFYDSNVSNIQFPLKTTVCDDSNTYTIKSSFHRPAVAPDLASIDSEISFKIEFY